jgi:four helix bundle protein
MSNYKKLDVWIFSIETVKEIYKLTRFYPEEERYGLISQTNRAAVSIPANIAEGLGRNHKKDSIQFLHISRGSAYEVETLLSVAREINIIDEKTFLQISEIVDRNIRVINGFINYLEKKI